MSAPRAAWTDPVDGSVTSVPCTSVAAAIEQAMVMASRGYHAWARDENKYVIYDSRPVS